MSQKIIRSKITKALAAWAGAKTPAIPIAREGAGFDKPANYATFLELDIIPADTFASDLEATGRRFLGEVMIKIWVKDGTGTDIAETLAEEICQLFPIVPKTYLPVSVETNPSIKRSVLDEAGYRITPVCFSYRAEF